MSNPIRRLIKAKAVAGQLQADHNSTPDALAAARRELRAAQDACRDAGLEPAQVMYMQDGSMPTAPL